MFYLAHPAYHALPHTKHTAKPYNKRHPNIRVPLNARSMGSARQTGHTPPQPHLRYPFTSKDEDPNKKILARQSCSRVQRTILFYLTHTGYHALLHIKHATNSTTKGTPYRVPSGQDPWVWPDNPAYPPWPHLRYPLTSKDEDPNKKILARQSCSRERRTLLFYLLYYNTT